MRHLNNPNSVQEQLNEIRELKTRLEILTSELKTYMEEHDIDILNGETTAYKRTWVNDSLIFDSTKFKADHEDLYQEYKTKEKAGYYRFEETIVKTGYCIK